MRKRAIYGKGVRIFVGRDRAVLSLKNPYYISKHRYYELKHFCLQYYEWQRAYRLLDAYPDTGNIIFAKDLTEWRDYTGDTATLKSLLRSRMEMVEDVARGCDEWLKDYIFMAVSEGRSYDYLLMNKEIPCGRDMFYDRRRKFFWMLSQVR